MRLSRRGLLQSGLAAGTAWLTRPLLTGAEGEPLTLGVLTDVHFADAPTRGSRHYRESLDKVNEAVARFSAAGVDRIIELGDLIDNAADTTPAKELAFLRSIAQPFHAAGKPLHCVLGNHCLGSLDKTDFLGAMSQRSGFFSFDAKGWHIVILDACYRIDGKAYSAGNFDWTDTLIPPHEQEWLKADLEETQHPTLVFAHQRLDEAPTSPHAVKSCVEVRKILSDSGKVAAVLQGHAHVNDLREIEGVRYATLAAVVEGSGLENSGYSVLRCLPDGSIQLEGFRHHQKHPLAVD